MAQITEVYHPATSPTTHSNGYIDSQQTFISFEKFCLIDAYLSILQQEINESSCVSPIKGTDHPPPTVYLTNAPGTSLCLWFNRLCRNFVDNIWNHLKNPLAGIRMAGEDMSIFLYFIRIFLF